MNSKIIADGILRALAIITAIVLTLLFLFKIKSVLIYITIAFVLTLIARPGLRFLRHKLKLPKTLSVVITITLFLLLITGIISMFIPLIVKQGHNISLLNTAEFIENIKLLISQIRKYISTKNIDFSIQLQEMITSNFQSIPSLLNSLIGFIGSLVLVYSPFYLFHFSL